MAPGRVILASSKRVAAIVTDSAAYAKADVPEQTGA
jgi:hypothetical protein